METSGIKCVSEGKGGNVRERERLEEKGRRWKEVEGKRGRESVWMRER